MIEDAATAGATLDPIRARLLAELVQPGSASSLAARVGQPRQKVNAAFAEEFTNAVTGLVAKYHDENAAGGRAYRVILAVHPSIPQTTSDDIKAP